MPEPIDLIILGSGSGVPIPTRQHPGILLRYAGEYLLFDCGEGTQTRLIAAGISPLKIDKIFITHWHADHFGGLLPLIETLHMEGRTRPLEIYAPDAERFVSGLLDLSYWGIGFEIKAINVDYEKPQQLIYENERYQIFSLRAVHSVPAVGYGFKERDSWHIIPEKAKKYKLYKRALQSIKNRGFVIRDGKKINLKDVAVLKQGRKIIYSGDTKFSKDIFKFARGADLLIHDATFVDAEMAKETYHSSVEKVAAAAKKYDVKCLVLTHFSKRYRDVKYIAATARKFFKNTKTAYDGMRIRL